MVTNFSNIYDMVDFVFQNRASLVSVSRVLTSRGTVKYVVILNS